MRKIYVTIFINIDNKIFREYAKKNIDSRYTSIVNHELNQASYKNFLSINYWHRFLVYKNKYKKNSNCMVILIAGDIGACISGMMIFGRKNKKLFWYIPMVSLISNSWWSGKIYKIKARLMKNVITITNYQVKQIKKYNPTATVYLCKNFFSEEGLRTLNNIKENLTAKTNIKNRTCVNFSIIGRFHCQKGHDILLAAIKEYSTKNKEVKVFLNFVGGERDEFIENYNNIDLSQVNTSFKPWTTNPFQGEIDAILMPSRYEGDPILLYESRYLGIPIFCSNIPPLSDLLIGDEKVGLWNGDSIRRIVKIIKSDIYNVKYENFDFIQYQRKSKGSWSNFFEKKFNL